MSPLLNSLTQIAPLIQFLTLVALVVYVWKTWAMASATEKSAAASQAALQEMRATREAESKPYIICHFATSISGKYLDLVVRNIGRTMAFDVVVQFNPPITRLVIDDETGVLKTKRFAAMPPGFEWRWRAGSPLFGDPNASVELFEADVRYTWSFSRDPEQYKLSFDAKSLSGGRFTNQTLPIEFLESIAGSLEELLQLIAERFPKSR